MREKNPFYSVYMFIRLSNLQLMKKKDKLCFLQYTSSEEKRGTSHLYKNKNCECCTSLNTRYSHFINSSKYPSKALLTIKLEKRNFENFQLKS